MTPPPARRVAVCEATGLAVPACKAADLCDCFDHPPLPVAAGPAPAWPAASIRLFPSSNLWSILADVRGAMAKTDAPAHLIAKATDDLLKAPSGTYRELAAEFVTIDTSPPEPTRRAQAHADHTKAVPTT